MDRFAALFMIAVSNLALVEAQALIMSALTAIIASVYGCVTKQCSLSNTLFLIATAISTSAIASVVIGNARSF